MGTKTPAAGGEKKPFIKHKGRPNNGHYRQRNNNCRNNIPRQEKFLVADPDFHGHVFKAKCNQSEQVVNFATVDDIIKAHVGTECDPFVLESLDKEVRSGPEVHKAAEKSNGTMTMIEEMKFKSKYDNYLNRVHKVEMQLKQTYSKYDG